MNIQKMLQRVSTGHPFIFIDKILQYIPGKTFSAQKFVTYNEPYYQGPCFDNPIMPEALLLETMIQASILMLISKNWHSDLCQYTLRGVKNANFRKPVVPGDILQIFCCLCEKKEEEIDFYPVSAEITVDNFIVATSILFFVKG